ncbi:MAG: hypothetical protein D6B26_00455 [Spirochaetaceae bacterium]|nr:MAG: hypothetical protein D6B26_00455 [Spirochaetaceae bacterium]
MGLLARAKARGGTRIAAEHAVPAPDGRRQAAKMKGRATAGWHKKSRLQCNRLCWHLLGESAYARHRPDVALQPACVALGTSCASALQVFAPATPFRLPWHNKGRVA